MNPKLGIGLPLFLGILLTLSLAACSESSAGAVGVPASQGMPATAEETAPPSAPASSPTETVIATKPPPTFTKASSPSATAQFPKKLDWDEANAFAGQTATVCGQVMGARFSQNSNGKPTFLNLGKDYPDPTRFVVLIWGDDRKKFASPPEEAFLQRVICVTGEIRLYHDTAEIIVSDPAQIEMQP